MVDRRVIEPPIRVNNFASHFSSYRQCPAVNFPHLITRNPIILGIEIADVSKSVSCSVAKLSIGVYQACQYLIRKPYVLGKVRRGDPQPEYLGSKLADDFVGRHRVA